MPAQAKRGATKIKIAYLGGGSRDWAPGLMRDLALCPQLEGDVYLYDLSLEAAAFNARLGEWTQRQPGVVSSWRYHATATMAEALQGADFVVCSIQPGPLSAMAADVAIPARYGLLFPVADTTGAAGLVRGLRAALIYEGFSRQIAAHCPQAWVINYTNPLSICTRTLTRVSPQLKVFGCCHEIHLAQLFFAGLVAKYLGVPEPPRQEIEVNVLGINHFTWLDRATYQGRDLFPVLKHHLAQPGVVREHTKEEVLGWGDPFACGSQVRFALFQRYGLYPAMTDRGLAEFVPGFLADEATMYRWGVQLTPVAFRAERRARSAARAQALLDGTEPFTLTHSADEGVEQMCALRGLGNLMTHTSIPNIGQAPDLPRGAVVETNAYFSCDSVRPLTAGVLPPAILSLVQRHLASQELMLEAALARNVDLAFQAVLNDPTTTLPIDRAWEMFQAMLVATKDYLPGFDIKG